MMREVQGLKTLVLVIAICIFSVQMMYALQRYMSGPTMITGGTKRLSSLNKPIQVTVCKTGQFNYTVAPLLGYKLKGDYVAGITTNASVLSWNGFDGNLTANETYNYLFMSATGNLKITGFGNVTARFILPYGVCSVATGFPHELANKRGLYKIEIDVTINGEFSIFVTDPSAAVNYQLPLNLMKSDAPRIKASLTSPVWKYYNIQLKEKFGLSGEEACVNYPDKSNHQSYADCVDEENYQKIETALGCMIPWMGGKSQKHQCKGPVDRLSKHESLIEWLQFLHENAMTGFQYKSAACPIPCTLLIANGRYMRTIYGNKANKVRIYISEKVDTRTVTLAYDLGSLLVEIGSSLGLWLGLSLVGLFDVLVSSVLKVKGVFQVARG